MPLQLNNKKKGATGHARLRPFRGQRVRLGLVVVPVVVLIPAMVMVVIVPVPVGMPPVAIFVPPLVRVRPAVLPRFMQLLACVYRLPAFPSMVLGSLMQPMIRSCDSPLASVFIRANRRRAHQ